jgi:hypothetical protein
MQGGVHLRDGNRRAVEIECLSIGCYFKVGLFDPDGEMTVLGDMDEAVILGLVVELLKGTDQSGIYDGRNCLG